MKQAELYKRLVQCSSSQLDAITVLLELNPAFLPAGSEPVATRASEILKLVKPQGRKGLVALKQALDGLSGAAGAGETGQPKQAKQAGKPACILVLAANPVDTDRLRLDREVKLIKDELRQGDAGRRYRVEMEWAASRSELSRHLLEYEPARSSSKRPMAAPRLSVPTRWPGCSIR
jgi:hypothetical protein